MPEALKVWFNTSRQDNTELWPYAEDNCANWLIGATALLTGYSRDQLIEYPIYNIEQLFLVAASELYSVSPKDLTTDDDGNYLPIVVECNNEDYICYMPSDVSQSAGALLEALETERVIKALKKDDAHMLAKLCAIYLRKEGERYQDVNTDERAAFFAKHLTYRNAMLVFFFLQTASRNYQNSTDTSLAAKATALQTPKQVLAVNSIEP
jgi:hypothetical protein